MDIVGTIIKIVSSIFGVLFIVSLIGIFLMVFVALGADFYKTMKYSHGYVCQENKCESVKEFQKEEKDCVYFIDVWDKSVKTCGVYSIQKYK